MATCNRCELPIVWKQLNGKWVPFDNDGEVHFPACKRALRAKDPNAPPQINRIAGPRVTGPAYTPDQCTCTLPPWQLCTPGCPHSIQYKEAA